MTQDTATTVGAVGAIASPVWLPYLHQISQIAAELAPILGAAWLITQIVVKIIAASKGK